MVEYINFNKYLLQSSYNMAFILGIDYGTKRIGTAISDETETIAQAFEILEVKNEDDGIEKLKELIEKYDISYFVIGQPLGIDSKPTQMSNQIDKFAEKLSENVKKEYTAWNETLTSEVAKKNRLNFKRGYIDSEAARIMLQEYLDFKRYKI